MFEQGNLFSEVLPKYRITKPIRLIELFAGIGAQFKALKQITTNVESYKICEWAYNSFCSYNAIHIKDFTDYTKNMSKEELIEKVNGISTDYNNPLTVDQLKKKNIEWLKNAYNNIKATHNLVNIMNVKASDLEIVDTDKYDYVMTYSFPCQDLSLAGKGKGMSVSQADGGTRSGLLWEVERILSELHNNKMEMPKILIMENVPEVIGTKNLKDFEKWELKLSQLGYSNFVKILNGKDYYIPQNRRRCFMVSILGNYTYDMPIRMQLKYYLKDFLELQVDEKYFLSEKMIKFFEENTEKQKLNGNGFKFETTNGEEVVAKTITTRSENRMDDNFIIQETNNKRLNETFILIPEATKKGYAEAHEGDGVYINRPHQKKRCRSKRMIQTIKTSCDDIGVVVKDEPKVIGGVGEKDSNNGTQWKMQNRIYDNKVGVSIATSFNPYYVDNSLRIRKLTPKECYRLMGFQDCDYQACKDIGMSDSAIYHIAGDSIVVSCLIALFSPLFNEPSKHREIIKDYVERIKDKND